MPIPKTGENDLHELQVNDSEYMKVLYISGIDFLHCWVADSIWLECPESLII